MSPPSFATVTDVHGWCSGVLPGPVRGRWLELPMPNDRHRNTGDCPR